MYAYVNGQFVDQAEAVVSVLDRSFMYGDGLFETIRVWNRSPVAYEAHLARMRAGASFLGMGFDYAAVRDAVGGFIVRNGLENGLIRIHLSRGISGRGYGFEPGMQSTVVITGWYDAGPVQPCVERVRLVVAERVRVDPGNPLNRFKTANKLPQILAITEAKAQGAFDALMLDYGGRVVEASSANVLWVRDGVVFAVPEDAGALPGIAQAMVLEVCRVLGLPVQRRSVTLTELFQAEAVFLTSAARGVIAVNDVCGHEFGECWLVRKLQSCYLDFIAASSAART